MAISINAYPGTSPIASRASSGYVDAQLAKCQAQLGDWVTCASSKTPEGKAKIASLTSQLSDLKQQKQAVDAAQKIQYSAANGTGHTFDHGSLVDVYV